MAANFDSKDAMLVAVIVLKMFSVPEINCGKESRGS
jgi:hypothetical protein